MRDDWGNWFGNDNTRPMYQFILPDRYLKRNPHFAPPRMIVEVPKVPSVPPVFPASRTLERFNDPHTANRITSAVMRHARKKLNDDFSLMVVRLR